MAIPEAAKGVLACLSGFSVAGNLSSAVGRGFEQKSQPRRDPGPSYGGVWHLKSLGFEGPKGCLERLGGREFWTGSEVLA